MSEAEQEKDSLFLTALYMVLFYLVFVLAGYVLIGLGIIQMVVRLLSGQPHDELKRFGASFGRYMSQIVDYISMKSKVKPYPFSEWPVVSDKKNGKSK